MHNILIYLGSLNHEAKLSPRSFLIYRLVCLYMLVLSHKMLLVLIWLRLIVINMHCWAYDSLAGSKWLEPAFQHLNSFCCCLVIHVVG